MTKKSRRLIAVVTAASVFLVLWGYFFLYDALVQRRWLYVITLIGAVLVGMAIQEAARRKAHSVDYRRR